VIRCAILVGMAACSAQTPPRAAPPPAAPPPAPAPAPAKADDTRLLAELRDKYSENIAGPFSRVDRSPSGPGLYQVIALDSRRAVVAKVFTIGKPTCEGVVARFCPSRTYTAPMSRADDWVQWEGSFVDDKLFVLVGRLRIRHQPANDDERRLAIPAFEAAVAGELGELGTVVHEPDATTISYEHGVVVSMRVGDDNILLRMTGKSQALDDLLRKQDEALVKSGH
jgi:hypothetical protein